MRAIGVVTTSRADYGIYRPVLRRLEAADDFELRLFVSGPHLSPEHGMTVAAIEQDGFTIQDRLEVMLAADSPSAVARTIRSFRLIFACSSISFICLRRATASAMSTSAVT